MELCPNHSECVRRIEVCEEEIRILKDKGTGFQVKQASIDEKLDNLLKMVMELKVKVEEMAKTPAKRWETVITTIITTAVSMGIGAAITAFFMR